MKPADLRLKQNPYHFLLLTGLVLLLISFLIDQNRTIDIHFHDTYLVLILRYVPWLLALPLWFLWFLYVITRKLLYSKRLTWIHVITTLVSLLVSLFIVSFAGYGQTERRLIDFTSWNTDNSYSVSVTARWIKVAATAFLLAQILFVINVLMGLYRLSLKRLLFM